MRRDNAREARAFARSAGTVDVSERGNPPAVLRRPVPDYVQGNALRLVLWAADSEAGLR